MAKKHLVGIDIGSTSIKLVETQVRKKQIEVQNVAKVDLPRDSIAEGTIINRSAVIDAIRSIFDANKIKNRNVAMAVYGHNVIIKKLSLPSQMQDELEQEIKFQAEEAIPFNTKEVYLASHIINPGATFHGKMNVLLVAAKKETVNDFGSLARECGLVPQVVEVVPFTLANIFEHNYGVFTDEAIALINIGEIYTIVNLLVEGVPVHSQHIQIGVRKFIDDLQKKLNLSFDDAQRIVRGDLKGFSPHIQEQSPLIIRASGQEIVKELVRPINFYVQNSLNIDISKAYISGGAIINEIFFDVVKRNIGYQIEVLNPFKAFSFNQARVDSRSAMSMGSIYSIAAGLSLRKMGE